METRVSVAGGVELVVALQALALVSRHGALGDVVGFLDGTEVYCGSS